VFWEQRKDISALLHFWGLYADNPEDGLNINTWNLGQMQIIHNSFLHPFGSRQKSHTSRSATFQNINPFLRKAAQKA
jgi:hypothetical protein